MRLVEVADGILVATSRRDSTTTTVVVGPGGRALLVDPAWEVDELESLADDLDTLGLTVEAGFSTHAHFDHLLWHPRFGDVPRWASPETVRRSTSPEGRAALLAELGPWPAELVPLVARVQELAAPAVPWPGPRVELVVHDAHVPGHTALWLPTRRVLLAGDMLSDVEPPLPEDGPDPLAAYAEGLDALEPFAAAAALLVPGHGSPTAEPLARLAADRRALAALAR